MNNVRRFFVIVLLAIIFVAVAQPAFATHAWYITGVSCDPATNTITISGYVEDESSVDTEVYVNGVYLGDFEPIDEPDEGPVSYTVTDPSFVQGAVILVQNDVDEGVMISASTVCGEEPACINPDNRLNRVCDHPEQSAAVYCRGKNIAVYAVDNGKGRLAFTVTLAELNKLPDHPETNILVEENLDARLYKLTTGEYQVNRLKPDGKDYVFTFDGC